MGVDHHHAQTEDSGRSLLLSMMLNLFITVTEFIAAIWSGSLALLSDALHNLGDTTAVFIAYFAQKISRKALNVNKTFGYNRIEILSALINSIVLISITLFLFIQAYERFINPIPVNGLVIFITATIALIANLLSVFLLRKHQHGNINIRAAYLHLLGDVFSSVAVIVAGLLLYFSKIYWIDPLITVIVGIYILYESIKIVQESINILMQGTPIGLDLMKIKLDLERMPGIKNIHHVHAWNLTDSIIHFECHLELNDDIKISETIVLRKQIETHLAEHFCIYHTTLQFGYECCKEHCFIGSVNH